MSTPPRLASLAGLAAALVSFALALTGAFAFGRRLLWRFAHDGAPPELPPSLPLLAALAVGALLLSRLLFHYARRGEREPAGRGEPGGERPATEPPITPEPPSHVPFPLAVALWLAAFAVAREALAAATGEVGLLAAATRTAAALALLALWAAVTLYVVLPRTPDSIRDALAAFRSRLATLPQGAWIRTPLLPAAFGAAFAAGLWGTGQLPHPLALHVALALLASLPLTVLLFALLRRALGVGPPREGAADV